MAFQERHLCFVPESVSFSHTFWCQDQECHLCFVPVVNKYYFFTVSDARMAKGWRSRSAIRAYQYSFPRLAVSQHVNEVLEGMRRLFFDILSPTLTALYMNLTRISLETLAQSDKHRSLTGTRRMFIAMIIRQRMYVSTQSRVFVDVINATQ